MIRIVPMKAEHIPDAVNLWKEQFVRYCYSNSFPDFTAGGLPVIDTYLKEQTEQKNAIIIKRDSDIIGYMAWMYFDFHKERTAFLPTAAHTASSQDDIRIYEEMYYHAAQKWVDDKRFNHLWMTYSDNHPLREKLYDIGFSSYVIDACQSTGALNLSVTCDYEISSAGIKDVDELLAFANLSNDYYAASPVFLKRNEYSAAEITEFLKDGYILTARDKGRIIGVMSFSLDPGYHFEHLTAADSSSIKFIGAFIHSDYRGRGIGTALLEKVFAICREKRKSYLHVSFETANPDAVHFWPKYFKPAIHSVRRTINKDI